jgi:glycosyltransferase involved in cell wall biosynthesis
MNSFYANFGANESRNGQVQKALALRTLLHKRWHSQLRIIDVCSGVRQIWQLIRSFASDKMLCVSLGRNGIRAFAALYLIYRYVFPWNRGPRLYYFVVGGWLPQVARGSHLLRWLLLNMNSVFVETDELARQLRPMGIHAVVFPNFRSYQFQGAKDICDQGLSLCFCSRIRPDKGPLIALATLRELQSMGVSAILHFYGPIEPSFRRTFLDALAAAGPCAQYQGSYDDEFQAISIMRRYDFMMLPTSYPGECMPGAIVEAFSAATPVVTSRWLYMDEIVRDREDGFVVPLSDFVTIAAQELAAVIRKGNYLKYSASCLTAAQTKYSENAAAAILDEFSDFQA